VRERTGPLPAEGTADAETPWPFAVGR
jgi:hypothetical protein